MSDYRFYILEPGVRDNQFGIFTFGNFSTLIKYLKYEYITSVPGFELFNWTNLNTLDMPNLTAIDAAKLQSGELFLNGVGVTAINAPNLVVTGGDTSIVQCNSLTAISFPSLVEVGGDFAMGNNNALRSISAPLLRSTNRNNNPQAAFELTGNPMLTSVNVPSLTSVGALGQIVGAGGTTSLSALSLSALVHAGDVLIVNFSALRNVDLSSFIPTPGKTISFSGANLTTASKDLILARCVANAAFTTGNVTLGGDALDAAGATSRATLTARGVTVNA